MNLKIVFFAALFYWANVSGALADYFRPVLNKSGFHQMRNIDFIYMINLDERPEKFADCLLRLKPYGIEPCRFQAINGWELSIDVINDIGVKYESWMAAGQLGTYYWNTGQPQYEIMRRMGRNYFCDKMPIGSLGCALSHLSILQDALDSNYETIWIMEDDIEVMQEPTFLSDLIERLDALVGKEGWDVLFTDPDSKGQDGNYVICLSYCWKPNFFPSNPQKASVRKIISNDFTEIGSRYGSYSMIIRRSGMVKLLEYMKKYQLFLPYDMEYTLPPGIRLYSTNYDVVSTQPQAPSDNGAPNYKINKEK